MPFSRFRTAGRKTSALTMRSSPGVSSATTKLSRRPPASCSCARQWPGRAAGPQRLRGHGDCLCTTQVMHENSGIALAPVHRILCATDIQVADFLARSLLPGLGRYLLGFQRYFFKLGIALICSSDLAQRSGAPPLDGLRPSPLQTARRIACHVEYLSPSCCDYGREPSCPRTHRAQTFHEALEEPTFRILVAVMNPSTVGVRPNLRCYEEKPQPLNTTTGERYKALMTGRFVGRSKKQHMHALPGLYREHRDI